MGWEFTRGFFAPFTPEQLDERGAFWNYATGGPAGKYRGDRPHWVLHGCRRRVFRAYSAFARGAGMLSVAYQYLGLVPGCRIEGGHDGPQFWVRRHDEY